MIYAVKHNKVNRGIYKANEDALTSTIFERLMYLPKELMHHIIYTALVDTIKGLELHQIESITFWPTWSADGIKDKSRVEPDVFIRTANQDIIIEAKRYDKNQQSYTQWSNEIHAYYNEYAEDEKPLVFIALGGLHKKETEIVSARGQQYDVYKCTWKAILNTIQNLIHEMETVSVYTNNNVAILNILNDMILSFELFGFSTSLWLERFIKAPQIKQESIIYFAKEWTN
ncbi:hypothetical protein [Nonlabens dokdonensis]|uniref:hypothetical protein n=1 Tax=Nonlabens dokdonensis TaxID=328515 RepID=UPI0026ED3471|nr:hypothetical protein [Nonlabens dokdonensis]